VHYRLGSLRPVADMSVLVNALRRRARHAESGVDPSRRRGRDTGELRKVLHRLMAAEEEAERAKSAPDLLAAAAVGEHDRAFARDVHSALEALRPGMAGVVLHRCEHRAGAEGYLAIAVSDTRCPLQPRPGDLVRAGFAALRDRRGGLSIWPRVYRVVCANGQIVYHHRDEDALARTGSVEAAVEISLTSAGGEALERQLQEAARTPAQLEPHLASIHEAEVHARIREQWEDEEDRTVYGVINAVTAAARSEEDFVRRIALERVAGRILAACVRLDPQDARTALYEELAFGRFTSASAKSSAPQPAARRESQSLHAS
jgi:hypothetical protein